MKKTLSLVVLFVILFVTLLPAIFADSHLPISLLNAQKSVDIYTAMTSLVNIPWQSLKVIFSPTYLVLTLLLIPTSILFFNKKMDLFFSLSFILINYISYFFQTGIISIFYINYRQLIFWAGFILLVFSALIFFYNAKFHNTKKNEKKVKRNIINKFLPWTFGISLGLFYFTVPRTIESAFEFTMSYYAYLPKFLFSLKIIVFLILHLLPIFIIIYLIKSKKQEWAIKINSFITTNRSIIYSSLSVGISLILIIIYIFQYKII